MLSADTRLHNFLITTKNETNLSKTKNKKKMNSLQSDEPTHLFNKNTAACKLVILQGRS